MQLSGAETIDWLDVEGSELDPTVGEELNQPCLPPSGTGIRNLMIAVLEDAVRGYVAGDPQEQYETEVWLANRERHFPFAFTVICETLGLEPDAVRKALRRMRAQTKSSRRAVIRARRNSRRASRIRVGRK